MWPFEGETVRSVKRGTCIEYPLQQKEHPVYQAQTNVRINQNIYKE
jgi:hypothetical protein